MTDDKLSTFACGTGPLAPGASTSCTKTHTITQADLDAGSITNTATASGNGATSAPASATVKIGRATWRAMAKSASPAAYSAVGQTITYTYTITNSGNVTLAGPFSLTEDKPGTFAWCIGPRPPRASTSCTKTHTITQADLDAGSITNTATASGNGATSAPASATVKIGRATWRAMAKSASPAAYSAVGQTITYTYTITNSGNVTLAGPFSLTEDKPGTFAWCIGPRPPRASTSCTKTHTITQADLDAGSITNTATASGNGATSAPASATVKIGRATWRAMAKSASPAAYSAVGQTITYTYTITNSGNVTLAGPFSLTEDKPGTFAWCIGPRPPRASTSCTKTHTITQADLDAGSITNTATASGNGATSAPASATVKIGRATWRAMAKSASPAAYSAVGQTITYTYTITNSGNVTLAGPFSLTEDKPGTFAWCIGPRPPRASTSCTKTHTITQADLDAGSITNTATASGNGATSAPASATVKIGRATWRAMAKSASPAAYSAVGQTITYTYTITNSGNVTLAGPFSLTEDKPGTFAWCIGPRPPRASTSCTKTHTITQADLDAGSITNTATASGNGATSAPASATVKIGRATWRAMAKSASPAAYSAVGQTITYTYTITNSGNVTLAGPFSLTEDKPGTFAWCIGPRPPRASTSCTKTHTITQADLDAGSITNTATASGNGATSAPASATVKIGRATWRAMAKSASPAAYSAVGQTITYTYTITNSGNVTLAGPFSLTEDKPGTFAWCIGPRPPRASTSCTKTHTITQADLDAGSITNTATASGNGATSAPASATVKIGRATWRAMAKSASPAAYSAVGQTITYTYTITNSGNVTLAGPFSLTEDKPGTFAWCIGPRPPRASTSCTKTHTITQADLDAGSITNTATASGNGATSAPASATVTATQTKALTLAKSASPATYSAVDHTITHTYTITTSRNRKPSAPCTMTDDKLSTFACGILPLAPRASTTCTPSTTLFRSDLDAGSITNTATASGNGATSAPASATVTATQTKALSLAKSASPVSYSAV